MNIKKLNGSMELIDRVNNYKQTFPNYTSELEVSYRIYGIWQIGNNYRNKTTYYGAYPPSFLKRVCALFPDCKDILQLFSGSLDNDVKGIRFDINPELNPDVVGDAHKLSTYFKEEFDLVIADPPYSQQDAEHYGTSMVKRRTVFNECIKVLKPGGFIVWLDQVFPMYKKSIVDVVGIIGLIQSTNHRVRGVFIYRKW